MICSSLECYSEAVAKSTITGRPFCNTCAIKIAGQFGTKSVETIEGSRFPWDYPADKKCEYCGVEFNLYITCLTGDCPACKKPIRGIKVAGLR